MTRMRQEVDLGALRRREPEAVESWFEDYVDRLHAFVYYRVNGDRELAADVVQEVFLQALGRIEDFDPDRGEMLPWLTYRARNVIRKMRRVEARKAQGGDLWEAVDERLLGSLQVLGDAPLQDADLQRAETAQLVRGALTHLSKRDQEILELKYLKEKTVKEIAAVDGATEGAIKTRLHRAREAFRAAFEAIVGALADNPPQGRAWS